MRLVTLTAFLIAAFSMGSLCEQAFLAVEKGPIDPELPTLSEYPGVETLIPLGHGGSANVYRAISSTGKKVILKIYRKSETAERDTLALNALKRDCSNAGFRIPEAKLGSDPRVVEIEDTSGKSLSEILKDPTIPRSLKNTLIDTYEAKFAALLKSISTNPQFRVEGPFRASDENLLPAAKFTVYDKTTGKPFNLLLKASNVVVDPTTLEFSLVDPE